MRAMLVAGCPFAGEGSAARYVGRCWATVTLGGGKEAEGSRASIIHCVGVQESIRGHGNWMLRRLQVVAGWAGSGGCFDHSTSIVASQPQPQQH